MFRGTTPTIYFTVNNIDDLSQIAELWITIKSKTQTLQKTLKDVAFNLDEKIIILELSQQDTLALSGSRVSVQLRFLFKDGKAFASKIMSMPLEQKLLRPGVMKPSASAPIIIGGDNSIGDSIGNEEDMYI